MRSLSGGLQIGDIIVHVEILNYAHVKDEDYYGRQRKFDFSDLSSKHRLALLKVESLKLNLIVLRPPVNIVEIATTLKLLQALTVGKIKVPRLD